MLRIIDDEQLVPTKILLPLRQAGDDTSITWDEFHFNNALLGKGSKPPLTPRRFLCLFFSANST